MNVSKITHDLLTGRDNATHDIGRYSWLISIVGLLALTAWYALHNIPTTLRDFGEAVAFICGGHGAAIGFKGKSEPDTPIANYGAEK